MDANFTIKHSTDINWKMSKPHFHDAYEILLCLSESCNFFINKDIYHLKRGSLVFIAEGTLHHSFVREGVSYQRYVLHFPPATLKRFASIQTDLTAVFSGLNCCVELDEARLQQVVRLHEGCLAHQGQSFGDDIRRNIFFLEMLLNFCELFETQTYVLPQREADFDKVTPIISFIDEHAAEPLPLDRLAAQFFINKYYLCHLFKEATGFTVVEYINNRRVLNARALLRQGANVQKAGEDSGFAGSAHFIRVFSKLSGQTPGQYAKAYKKSEAQMLGPYTNQRE